MENLYNKLKHNILNKNRMNYTIYFYIFFQYIYWFFKKVRNEKYMLKNKLY
jgi:hypothetical protein